MPLNYYVITMLLLSSHIYYMIASIIVKVNQRYVVLKESKPVYQFSSATAFYG